MDRYPHEDDQARDDRKFDEFYDWKERMGLGMLDPLITLQRRAAWMTGGMPGPVCWAPTPAGGGWAPTSTTT